MKKLLLTLFLLTTGLGIFSSQAQDNLILISGKIIDKDSKEPLIGAGIQVKGTVTGSITDSKGALL
ncbi:carboxypeptidase-like regulatory domain-containing protein [Pseudarcicella hirudinis]|uniref:carboxypeptidase-like regulatory domain-containing protein n=1 Tax=Pseudarcicella hirudinis TaxID=1079859 RepID=UPI0035E66D26